MDCVFRQCGALLCTYGRSPTGVFMRISLRHGLDKMRYFAPALILVFALAGCVSPEEKATAEARADSLAREEQARAQAERRRAQATLQELVAQAFEADASIFGSGSSDWQRARDARRDLEYALAMEANAEYNASIARSWASGASAERWRAYNQAAELWDRVAEARDVLE